MSCASCGGAYISLNGENKQNPIAGSGTDCPFSEDQLLVWQQLFLCVKQKTLYTETGLTQAQINSALGIIYSALNHKNNICYFQNALSQIQPLTQQIITSGLCN